MGLKSEQGLSSPGPLTLTTDQLWDEGLLRLTGQWYVC